MKSGFFSTNPKQIRMLLKNEEEKYMRAILNHTDVLEVNRIKVRMIELQAQFTKVTR